MDLSPGPPQMSRAGKSSWERGMSRKWGKMRREESQ